jgi:hypothetical protein
MTGIAAAHVGYELLSALAAGKERGATPGARATPDGVPLELVGTPISTTSRGIVTRARQRR